MNSTKLPLLKQHKAIMFKSRKAKSKSRDNPGIIKCILVGDGAVGKTSLAVSYSNYTFPKEYVPTAFDNYSVIVEVDGKPINIQICDTAGQDELNSLRGLCYSEADVFMLCFSVVRPETFQRACTQWMSELKQFNVPIVLIGTQSDLRECPQTLEKLHQYAQLPVTYSQALQLAEQLNGAPYIETSALNQHRLKEAFDQAILTALTNKNLLRIEKKSIWKRLCCLN